MSDIFTPAEQSVLTPYVTNFDHSIFLLKNLPEEVVAVLFAYYSRSRESLRRNLLKLIHEKDLDLHTQTLAVDEPTDDLALAREKAKQFHEKWVVGYGHASVAEHAVTHIALEDVSIIASKIIEDARLASYTEKSTRYVVFEKGHYYRVPCLMASSSGPLYEKTCDLLFDTYDGLMPRMIQAIQTALPRRPEQSERGYEAACKAKACDILRYLLPAATLTNIGLTLNARSLEHLITKMLSHSLEEARQIATLMKEEAVKLIPTLLKYADYNAYIFETHESLESLARKIFPQEVRPTERPVALVRGPEDAEDHLIGAILYGYTRHRWEDVLSRVKEMAAQKKERILDEYLSRRGPHDQPLRSLEHLYYTFDILVDFGAFRDIQRHRMATQTTQDLNPYHGYSMPEEIASFGFQQDFDQAMEQAASAYERIAEEFPKEAQYVLPLAFRKRVLFTWNLRELHHFIQLRSAKQGHISYRRIAQQVYDELCRVHPLLSRYIRVDRTEYSLGRL